MEEVQLNPKQRKVIPNIAALSAVVIALVGLFTPWITLGGSGISGSASTPGRLTFFVIAASTALGLSGFLGQLQRYAKLISAATILVCALVLVSYGMWLFQVLRAISEFNNSVGKLDDLGGLLGDALANITESIKPSITTGFYMVLVATLIVLVAALVIFFDDSSANEINGLSEQSVIPLSRIQIIVASVLAALGLVVVIALSGNSDIGASLNGESKNSNSSRSANDSQLSSTFNCIKITNVGNVIKLNQPRFSGDSEPTDIFVATKIRLKNNCSKEIVGVKGNVDFQNVVGDTIFTGQFTEDTTIPVGGSITTSADYGWTFNEFDDEHGQLSGIDQSKTNAILVLVKVAFADGSSLSE
jgi:hypothetical protein